MKRVLRRLLLIPGFVVIVVFALINIVFGALTLPFENYYGENAKLTMSGILYNWNTFVLWPLEKNKTYKFNDDGTIKG